MDACAEHLKITPEIKAKVTPETQRADLYITHRQSLTVSNRRFFKGIIVPVIHIPHARKVSFTDTAEPLAYQADLLPTQMLAELQHLHGLNTHEEFQDVDDDLEGLNTEDQNVEYDLQCNTDEAAIWLARAGMLCA